MNKGPYLKICQMEQWFIRQSEILPINAKIDRTGIHKLLILMEERSNTSIRPSRRCSWWSKNRYKVKLLMTFVRTLSNKAKVFNIYQTKYIFKRPYFILIMERWIAKVTTWFNHLKIWARPFKGSKAGKYTRSYAKTPKNNTSHSSEITHQQEIVKPKKEVKEYHLN